MHVFVATMACEGVLGMQMKRCIQKRGEPEIVAKRYAPGQDYNGISSVPSSLPSLGALATPHSVSPDEDDNVLPAAHLLPTPAIPYALNPWQTLQ